LRDVSSSYSYSYYDSETVNCLAALESLRYEWDLLYIWDLPFSSDLQDYANSRGKDAGIMIAVTYCAWAVIDGLSDFMLIFKGDRHPGVDAAEGDAAEQRPTQQQPPPGHGGPIPPGYGAPQPGYVPPPGYAPQPGYGSPLTDPQ
jgi:hypothetical protein